METEQPVVAEPQSIPLHFCPCCASVMYRSTWDGMEGWQCPDPDCGFFEID